MFQEYEEKRKKDGFFPQLYKAVCNAMGDENIDKLETMRDDMPEMIKFTYELKCFKDSLEIKEFYPEKNLYESKAKKDYGNKAYKDGKDLDALYHYSQAIIAAPVGQDGKSRELSILLANRSAVLFSLKAYGMALDDINLAFRLGYPDDLAYKLYDRKAKCLVAFKQMADAGEAYKLALKYVDKATKLSGDRKTQVQREIMQALAFFKNAPAHLTKNQPEVSMVHQAEVPEIPNKNSLYPVMSDAITFKYEENRGRFAVASKDITVGEVVTVEKAIVSHMLPEYMGKNCSHCFKTMKAPIPCFTCTKVMFCSLRCRDIACSTYHKYECKLVDLFISSGMSIICYLAYRSISQKPLQWFLDNKHLFDKHDKTSGQTKEQKDAYISGDYKNYYNLVNHHDQRKIGDIFHRSMFTVFLLRCLQSQGYFPTPPGDKLTEDEVYIGSLLMHFLELLQFNAHEVAQFEQPSKTSQEGAKSVFIGAGVYPTLALFNHSCDPCIVRYYVEDYVVVQAIKNIRKGEEICENYGPIFFHSDKEDRISRLEKQYWFKCQCIACTENWPTMHEMTQDVLNFRCPIKECGESAPFHTSSNMPSLRCGCGQTINLFKGLKELADTEILSEAANTELEKNNLEQAQLMFTQLLQKYDSIIAPPYPDYYKIQQNIWKCIWMRFGNRLITGGVRKPVTPADEDYDTVD